MPQKQKKPRKPLIYQGLRGFCTLFPLNVNRLRRKLAGVGLVDFIATRHGVGYIVE